MSSLRAYLGILGVLVHAIEGRGKNVREGFTGVVDFIDDEDAFAKETAVADLAAKLWIPHQSQPYQRRVGEERTVLKSNHCVLMTSVPITSSVVCPRNQHPLQIKGRELTSGKASYKLNPIAWMGMFRFESPTLRNERMIRAGMKPPPPIAVARDRVSGQEGGKGLERRTDHEVGFCGCGYQLVKRMI